MNVISPQLALDGIEHIFTDGIIGAGWYNGQIVEYCWYKTQPHNKGLWILMEHGSDGFCIVRGFQGSLLCELSMPLWD